MCNRIFATKIFLLFSKRFNAPVAHPDLSGQAWVEHPDFVGEVWDFRVENLYELQKLLDRETDPVKSAISFRFLHIMFYFNCTRSSIG